VVAGVRILDLFCGAGGAAMGYHRAGFEVVGVDISPQPHYPFKFYRADAMEAIGALGTRHWLTGFDVIHASPPCQDFTTMSNRWRGAGGKADQHVDLLTPVRELFAAIAIPWVIENVVGSKGKMRPTLVLHGGMFGLGVDRPRYFESNVLLFAPEGPRTIDPIGVYGKAPDGRRLFTRTDGSEQRAAASLEEAQAAMGMDWADWNGVREAIPPAYTEWIGRQLLAFLEVAA
jgi:DNA (cytosine-5)-methyltransferase 1